MKSATTAGWPAKVRRRDGTLVAFDVTRIEAAVARAAREVAYDDPDMPVTVARAVADALGPRIAPVEEIQDFVAARLGEAGLDDVARAYIIYRQRRAELRTAKALLGVRDELKLSLAAVTVLRERYLLRDEQGRPTESTGQMMDRAARCVAAAEDDYRPGSSTQWAERFSTLLRNLEFLPNSPTLMNAGTDIGLLAGCFVLPVEDSLHSIFTTLGQAAEIQRAGGGIGYAFSHLRPAGDRVASTGGTASGPVSFLRLYDTAAGVVSMGGRRRGACMAVLDASHPDIYDFITTKADSPSELTHFNLSVGVTDAFLRAVERGATHGVVNPRTGKTVARMPAAELFDIICEAAHACGDPGLVFIDTIDRANPVPGRGRIEATNPCGEVPLVPYESCNLGSINLARMITDGRVDWDRLAEVAGVAVRFLDDVIDVSRYPFSELGEATRATRKIGLGVMGLAELLATFGIWWFYAALAAGPISVVSPLAAVVVAAIPVIAGVALGERPGVAAAAGIVLALIAVVLISRHVGDRPLATSIKPRRGHEPAHVHQEGGVVDGWNGRGVRADVGGDPRSTGRCRAVAAGVRPDVGQHAGDHRGRGHCQPATAFWSTAADRDRRRAARHIRQRVHAPCASRVAAVAPLRRTAPWRRHHMMRGNAPPNKPPNKPAEVTTAAITQTNHLTSDVHRKRRRRRQFQCAATPQPD